jgi:CTP-dependent riboflavin kinase
MEGAIYITAAEMAEMLGISKPYAYKLIKQMNEELDAKGFITISGKVATKYFEEKFYGVRVTA